MKSPDLSLRVFIVGLPGSGKTTAGRLIAKRLNKKFYDLDHLIEESKNQSIAEIFNELGEEHFRTLEHEFLRKLIDEETSFVLSTGGGAPCFHKNMEIMNNSGLTVYLNPPIPEIVKRVTGRSHRPMFQNTDPEILLKKLYQQRHQVYIKAHLNVTEENFTEETFDLINSKTQDQQ